MESETGAKKKKDSEIEIERARKRQKERAKQIYRVRDRQRKGERGSQRKEKEPQFLVLSQTFASSQQPVARGLN